MNRYSLLLIISLLLLVSPASAQEPERTRELVYHVNAFEGQAWEGVFYPQSEETIYLLAGHPNTITPRETLVYFWTITQRFLPDWTELDEPVEARMEILRDGNVINTVTMSDYALQGERATTESNLQLYTAEEARRRYREYQEALDAYWVALEEYTERRTAGEAGDAPQAPSLFSTQVLQGFVVNLEEGSYEIRLYDSQNQLIPNSQKQVRVFSHRRSGLAYELIPEARWTVREQSETPDETIYVTGDERLFLQPYYTQEYNALLYGKLRDPQAPPEDERDWHWALQQPITEATLNVTHDSREIAVPHGAFTVEQSGRSSLGYTISAIDPDNDGDRPSFTGYELSLTLAPGESVRLRLVDTTGNELRASRRVIRGVEPLSGNFLVWPALIPFALGLFLTLRRFSASD